MFQNILENTMVLIEFLYYVMKIKGLMGTPVPPPRHAPP